MIRCVSLLVLGVPFLVGCPDQVDLSKLATKKEVDIKIDGAEKRNLANLKNIAKNTTVLAEGTALAMKGLNQRVEKMEVKTGAFTWEVPEEGETLSPSAPKPPVKLLTEQSVLKLWEKKREEEKEKQEAEEERYRRQETGRVPKPDPESAASRPPAKERSASDVDWGQVRKRAGRSKTPPPARDEEDGEEEEPVVLKAPSEKKKTVTVVNSPSSHPNRWVMENPFTSGSKWYQLVTDADALAEGEEENPRQPTIYRWVTKGKKHHLEAHVVVREKVTGHHRYRYVWRWINNVWLDEDGNIRLNAKRYPRIIEAGNFPQPDDPPEEKEKQPTIVVPAPTPPVKPCPPSGGPALILPSGFVPPDPCSAGTYGQPGGWKTWKYDTMRWPLRANSTGQYLDWQTRAHRAGR